MDEERKPYRYSLGRFYEWLNSIGKEVKDIKEDMDFVPPHEHRMSEVRGLAEAMNGNKPLEISVDWDDVLQKPEEFVSEATHERIAALEADKMDVGSRISAQNIDGMPDVYPPAKHGHVIDDVEGLRNALDRKRDVQDHETIGEIPGLGDALDDMAPREHTHVVADVKGLSDALDGKAASKHNHAVADVTGLQVALDGKAASKHSHSISDTDGLQVALDSKAASKHSHAASEVSGLSKDIVDIRINGVYLVFVRRDGSTTQVKTGGLLGL